MNPEQTKQIANDPKPLPQTPTQPENTTAFASSANSSPKSTKSGEVLIDFNWSQFLAPYDEHAKANFELPRVPQITVDLETKTVSSVMFGGPTKRSNDKQPSAEDVEEAKRAAERGDDLSDVVVIDRAAVEATRRAEEGKRVEELKKMGGLSRTPSVKRTIQRRKL
ncbi:hypothetical protein CVT24_011231 [Panaeolus cyanescens]|uniref:Uncharacterized protein n=1 Tax=Panaeolus cyanescens TaxID=181874 RepID=A0A409YGJ9_9AGAR|nr:hypothetical protein CVT24_011231 [Panaeolus cyanescens]